MLRVIAPSNISCSFVTDGYNVGDGNSSAKESETEKTTRRKHKYI